MADRVELVRTNYTTTVTVAAGGATSTYFVLDGFAMGTIHLPSTYDSTAITFTVCPTTDGTYQVMEDTAGNPVALAGVEASKSYPIPESLFGSPYAKIVGGTNEGGAGSTITITLRP